MAEPPHVWTVPGEEPDDRDAWGKPPVASPLPTSPTPAAPGSAPPPTEPTAPVPPSWGAPPQPGGQHSWGPPPGQPTQWGNGPTQWGGQPAPGDGRPPQWGGPPPPGTWTNRGQGIIPMRPLAIGEIYDGAIRAIRANPRTMVGFSAIVISLLTLLATAPQAYFMSALLTSPLTTDPEAAENPEFADVAELMGAGGIAVVVSVLQYVIATTVISALLIVAVDGAVRGQTLNPGQLWARCRPRLFAILGLAIMIPLVQLLVLAVAVTPGVIVLLLPSSTVVGVILVVIGVLVAIVVSLALYFGFWAVAAPALLLENLGVFAALRRSYRLARGSFWRVFGISLLTAVIASIVRQLFEIPFGLIGAVWVGVQGDDGFVTLLIQLLISGVGTVLAGAVLYPFTAGVSALLYLDLRMRKEGLDVDVMRS